MTDRAEIVELARAACDSGPDATLKRLLHVVFLLNGDVSHEAQQIRGLVSVFQTFKLALAANQIQAICAGVVALLEAPKVPGT